MKTRRWPKDHLGAATEVLRNSGHPRAYPRLDIAVEFADRFDEQAIRKPTSAAAFAVRSGIRARIASNELKHD
jgi:hypothetical protein